MNRSFFSRGLGDTVPAAIVAPAPTVEEGALYVFAYDLTALQTVRNVSRDIDKDSDFLVTHIYGSSTGAYALSMKLPSGRLLMNAPIMNTNFIGSAQWPVPLPGEGALFPAGSSISLDLYDKSNAPNSIELIFKGIRIYRTR